MSYTVPPFSIITYPPEALASFEVHVFEWIDNLHFIQPPEKFLPDPSKYLQIARKIFSEAGWDGHGEIGLLWLPPFVLPIGTSNDWLGTVVWHVKQLEDGISWLLSPQKLPFRSFGGRTSN